MAPFANTMLCAPHSYLGTLAARCRLGARRLPREALGPRMAWWPAWPLIVTGYALLAYSRGGAAGRGHGGCGRYFRVFCLAAGTVELAVLWGSLHGRLRPAPGAFVAAPFPWACAALVGLLLSSTTFGVGLIVFAVLGPLASLPVPCLAGVAAPAGRLRAREIWAAGPRRLVRHRSAAGGGGISGPHAPGAAGVFGLGVRHAAGGPHGVRLHDGSAQVRPVRRGAHGGARLRAGRRGGASHLPSCARAVPLMHAHLSGAGAACSRLLLIFLNCFPGVDEAPCGSPLG